MNNLFRLITKNSHLYECSGSQVHKVFSAYFNKLFRIAYIKQLNHIFSLIIEIAHLHTRAYMIKAYSIKHLFQYLFGHSLSL
jgi:hypothetical protein